MKTATEKHGLIKHHGTALLGGVFAVCMCVLFAAVDTRGDESLTAALEPVDLLDLSLSDLGAVTNETSAAARTVQEQKQAKRKETAYCGTSCTDAQAAFVKPLPLAVVPAETNIETTDTSFKGINGGEAGPFTPYPLFAADPGTPLATGPLTGHVTVKHEPKAELANHLWQSRITAPAQDAYGQMKLELQKIIYQVRAIEVESKQAMTAAPSEPNQVSSDVNDTAGRSQSAEMPSLPYKPVNDQTLKALEQMCSSSDSQSGLVRNAFELAEILFNSGRLEQAAAVYRLAFGAASSDGVVAEDKAWMLFQVGNCLKDSDPNEAMSAYKQLIAEYSDCMWKNMAKSQLDLLNWYAGDKPRQLIRQTNTDPGTEQ